MKKSFEPEQTLHRTLSTYKSLTSPTTDPKPPISDDEFVPACQFVTQLVSRANQYGSSFVRLQDFMSQLPHLFGFHGVMLVAAPFVFFEFWRPGDPDSSRVIVRQPQGSFDLAKLSAVSELVNEMADEKISFDNGTARLKEIDTSSPPWKVIFPSGRRWRARSSPFRQLLSSAAAPAGRCAGRCPARAGTHPQRNR